MQHNGTAKYAAPSLGTDLNSNQAFLVQLLTKLHKAIAAEPDANKRQKLQRKLKQCQMELTHLESSLQAHPPPAKRGSQFIDPRIPPLVTRLLYSQTK